jgi:hypothetical protein
LGWVAVGLKAKVDIQKKYGINTTVEYNYGEFLTFIYVSMSMKTAG